MKLFGYFHELYHRAYEGAYKHARHLFFLDMLLLVGIVGAAGVLVFSFFWSPTVEKYIDVQIDLVAGGGTGGENIVSGGAVEAQVQIKNRSKVDIKDARLEIAVPGGFIKPVLGKFPLGWTTSKNGF